MQHGRRPLVLAAEDVLRRRTVLMMRRQFGLRARHVGQGRAPNPRWWGGWLKEEDPRPGRGVHIQPLGEPKTYQPRFISGLRRQGLEVRMTGLCTGVHFSTARSVTLEEGSSNPRS